MMGSALRPQYFCRFGSISAVMGLVFLSSCSILPKAEKLEIYQLPSSSIPRSAQAGSLPWALRIATPHSSQLTDSMRVLVLRQDNQISAYKGIRWGNPAPILLRDQLAVAFRIDGRFSSVSSGNNNLMADLELGGDLTAFQVEYKNGIPAVNIRLYATLVQPGRNRIVATRSFEIIEPVQGREIPEVIAAFGRATDRLAAEIIDWTPQYEPASQPAVE
ncbi:ABC-type transport auxiliary lipoprotein family protein [Nitrosospira sp. Nsp1]|uniref:ABC-type transport auxiliary lipoprotein family protein n=1 Tax=Nitrosospira sp. Nsp1 TaxID=136547 RepID=UPI00088208EA|nr:ABC-type transport auxiliary lipoprotein family protein [Nitrosospira sp. Nsp1]SCX60743.1 cholesterol transport system auxiliary component [Nitrosospira sp. Nsp1]